MTDKSTIIANLDLELSQRVHRLKAQYATMAQSLNTRGEMRIQRLTKTTRTTKISEFIKRYEAARTAPTRSPLKDVNSNQSMKRKATSPVKPSPIKTKKSTRPETKKPTKRVKRVE